MSLRASEVKDDREWVYALGASELRAPARFMEPTILTNIKPGNPAYRKEFFGPLALMFRVRNEYEAAELAKDSDFGLGGAVFTRDGALGQPHRDGHGLRQSPHLVSAGVALWRHHEFRLWP